MFLSRTSKLSLATAIPSLVNNISARHGAQGTLDRASNALLENEFGTKDHAEVLAKILEQGDVKETRVSFFFPNF